MNSLALSLVVVSALALLILPRRWAPLALLAGACYMTIGQGIEFGSFTFTVIRMLVVVGVLRVILRREGLPGGLNAMDWIMIAWATWVVASGWFHGPTDVGPVFRLGLVFNAAGIYFLLRIFCRSLADVLGLCRIIAILLIPVAAEMVYEHVTFHNLFSVFGGVPEVPQLREGKIRAFGPFTHPILAGTVGAVCLPLMIGMWQFHRVSAAIGVTTCLAIILCSASSGPIMSALASMGALLMWSNRNRMRAFRWACVVFYVLLDLVMEAPAYYLIARIDVAGGSTGWHRARLIEASMTYVSEWWAAGTDYTRHWMPTGVTWNPNHTDITNHYLYMGVLGGLPLMFLFIASLAIGFSYVGHRLKVDIAHSRRNALFVWALGAALFAHVATCISVSYFDQSFVFLYLTMAALASVYAEHRVANSTVPRDLKESLAPSAYRRSTPAHQTVPLARPVAGRVYVPRRTSGSSRGVRANG